MEAAAETVKQLTRTILPERPHQLAQSPDWKCRYPPDEPSKRPEEWHDTRLQYMTFLSDADRGVLFTRNYYDFRPEPAKPAIKEVNALARSGAPKKTLSLSDYKNKKTGATPSDTPTESTTPTQASRKPADRLSAAPTSESKPGPDYKAPPEPSIKVDGKKPSTENGATGKSKAASENIVVDMSHRLPPKPPGLPPKPPTPENRKRAADVDDGTRPPKRPKPTDSGRPGDDKSHTPRGDDSLRRKAGDIASSRESNSHRSLNSSSSSLPNGRAISKGAANSSRGVSPPPRSRGDSINGVKNSAVDGYRGTSHRMDSSSKSSVPPLLSPLHLDMEGNKDDYDSRRAERRYRDEGDSRARPAKNHDAQKSSKRQRSPVRLPPLLSPTLPPEVEAELERRRKDASPSPDTRIRDKDFAPRKKKAPEEPSIEVSSRNRGRYIYTFKIPKRLRREFSLLMKLSPRKESQRSERPPSAQPAKPEKRPAASADSTLEPSAAKRPRTSDAPTAIKGPAVPSTPSKKSSTAMSRVSSSNSMAHTPGDGVAATPTMPGSSERASHERAPLSKATEAKIRALREKEDSLRAIGRQLKHKGDLALKGGSGDHSASTNGSARSGEQSTKAGYALMVESIASFMTGFHIQDVHRGLAGKPSDPKNWTTLFPLIDMLQKDMRRFEQRRYAPIHALTLLLQGVSHDQCVNAWTTFEDPSGSITVKHLVRHERSRKQIWSQFRDTNEQFDNTFRVNVPAWYAVEEVVDSTLRVLRRWCADEGVNWSADLNLREHGLKSIDRH